MEEDIFEKSVVAGGTVISVCCCFVLCFMFGSCALEYRNSTESVRLKHYKALQTAITDNTTYRQELEILRDCIEEKYAKPFVICDIGVSATSLDDRQRRKDIVKLLQDMGWRVKLMESYPFCSPTAFSGYKGTVRSCSYKDVISVN